jgi:hypothetical protein
MAVGPLRGMQQVAFQLGIVSPSLYCALNQFHRLLPRKNTCGTDTLGLVC